MMMHFKSSYYEPNYITSKQLSCILTSSCIGLSSTLIKENDLFTPSHKDLLDIIKEERKEQPT